MTGLLTSRVVTYEVTIDEDTLKARLLTEALEQLGIPTAPGQRPKGMTHQVLRGENRRGGYRIRITRDLDNEEAPKLAGPEGSRDA